MTHKQKAIQKFSDWFNEELELSTVKIPTAVCLSTMGVDDFPNARFVSFKELVDDSFIITGPLNSQKGLEIANNHKVALTFWWTETERQVRIQGHASVLSPEKANHYFKQRSIASQAVSSLCEQGKELVDREALELKTRDLSSQKNSIPKPADWSGFSIRPIRMEFMQFKSSRFHERTLYECIDGSWTVKQIQP